MDMYIWFSNNGDWPDGESLFEQPSFAVEVFAVIKSELAKEEK